MSISLPQVAVGPLLVPLNPFGCSACNIAGAAGEYNYATPGTRWYLDERWTGTLLTGQVWSPDASGDCLGTGTPIITCHWVNGPWAAPSL